MAARTLKLEVVSPERAVLSDSQVVSVVLPGIEGYLGVMANHAPLMTEIDIGRIDFRREDGTEDSIAVCGGFVEVYDNTVTILVTSGELREELDTQRAEAALERAKQRLGAGGSDIDLERASTSLKRALNRLHVAGRSKV
jgi:F-type H+-transporting ATPase subunit epsilon